MEKKRKILTTNFVDKRGGYIYVKGLDFIKGGLKAYYTSRKEGYRVENLDDCTKVVMNATDFLNIKSAKALTDDLDGDGKVITLYGLSTIKQDEVKEHLKTMADSRLIVICPKKGIKLFKQIRDYEIIQELKNNSTFTHNNEILKD